MLGQIRNWIQYRYEISDLAKIRNRPIPKTATRLVPGMFHLYTFLSYHTVTILDSNKSEALKKIPVTVVHREPKIERLRYSGICRANLFKTTD
jgi:hypothetical protein